MRSADDWPGALNSADPAGRWGFRIGRKNLVVLSHSQPPKALTFHAAGHENPCASAEVKKVFRGLRRKVGTATRKKAALLTEHFRGLRREPQTVAEFRDRALLLVGFGGALLKAWRRS